MAAEVAGSETHREADHKCRERPKRSDEERDARTVKEPHDLAPSELIGTEPHPWLGTVRFLVVRQDVLLGEAAVEEVGGEQIRRERERDHRHYDPDRGEPPCIASQTP